MQARAEEMCLLVFLTSLFKELFAQCAGLSWFDAYAYNSSLHSLDTRSYNSQ